MTRWTDSDLDEFNTKRGAWVDVDSEDVPDVGPEAKLQIKCLKYLKEKGYPCFHDWSRKKNSRGWPDLFCFLPEGRIVLIELKAGSRKLREEQLVLRRNLNWLGYNFYVVRSYRRFIEIMKGEINDES